MTSPTQTEFEQFTKNYIPFPWEVAEEDAFQPADVKGKHSVLVSFTRFRKVMAAIKENCANFNEIVDVGPYPGAMIKMLRHFFPQNFVYWGIGLSMSDDYRNAMSALGGKCFTTELDPSFLNAQEVREWPVRNSDCALLLDVIEHLVNPIPCLDSINRALRMDGIFIVTTDNLAAFSNTYQMVRRGKSPNIHPLRSSLLYHGEWRPHFREFSVEELAFYLEYSGFSIVSHEFFERRQGDYYIDESGAVQSRNRYRGVKGLIQRVVLKVSPHLRDHHLVVARKVKEFSDIERTRIEPTTSKADWLKMRMELGV